jgi:F-type H+-transporting ATPase subunit epsilon
MRLTVTTPLAVIADVDQVAHVRAEDETGAFGVLPGHADFLTALAVSVVTWRDEQGTEHHLAVRRGMLSAVKGRTITIATREAIADDDLPRLRTEVLAAFNRRAEEEQTARADAQRLYLTAIREICRYLSPGRTSVLPSGSGVGQLDGRSS